MSKKKVYLVGNISPLSNTVQCFNLHKILFLLTFTIFLSDYSNSQNTDIKHVTIITVKASELNTEKKIWLYLPKTYDNSKKSYPVLYMHDAQNLFDSKTSYAGEWHVDEFLDTVADNESIVVAVEHGNEKRIDELTPFKNKKYGGGSGDNYLEFMVNTLKPYIDSNYRTKKERKNTTILGSSLGGLISFYAVLKYPDTFGKVGVFSPAFWINPEIIEYIQTSKGFENSKFYFMAGTEESESMISDMDSIITILKEKGVPNTYIKTLKIKGGKHNEQLWSNQFGDAYHWLTD